MAGSILGDPLIFIVDFILGMIVLIFMLRLLFQLVRADYNNPISQFIVTVTAPVLRPLRRIIPGWAGIDWSSVVAICAIQALAVLILVFLQQGMNVNFTAADIVFTTLFKLVSLLFNIYIFSIFIIVILSWVAPGTYNPIAALLYSLTEPLMRPARRIIPPIGGLDLSPMVVLLVLYVLQMIVLRLIATLAA